jgi:hypothetical protein
MSKAIPAWTVPSPLGGPPVPFYVGNPVPTLPDGWELVATRLIQGRGKNEKHHKIRISLIRNQEGHYYTCAERAREMEGSLSGVRVWFYPIPAHEVEDTPWLNTETSKIWNEHKTGQTKLF